MARKLPRAGGPRRSRERASAPGRMRTTRGLSTLRPGRRAWKPGRAVAPSCSSRWASPTEHRGCADHFGMVNDGFVTTQTGEWSWGVSIAVLLTFSYCSCGMAWLQRERARPCTERPSPHGSDPVNRNPHVSKHADSDACAAGEEGPFILAHCPRCRSGGGRRRSFEIGKLAEGDSASVPAQIPHSLLKHLFAVHHDRMDRIR